MNQVADDMALLDRMMDDQTNSVHSRFKPTQYWLSYQDDFVRELKTHGLRDFRRRDRLGFYISKFPTFGASDWIPTIVPRAELLGWRGARLLDATLRLISKYMVAALFAPSNHYHLAQQSYAGYFHSLIDEKFSACSLQLRDCAMSLYGNPEDVCIVDGNAFSLAYLTYCSMFIDVWQRIGKSMARDFVCCEIGQGLGRNVEIIGKLFPKATLICFDIAPQLYVSHQYLAAIFSDRLITYDDAIRLLPHTLPRGKIILLPAWRIDSWSSAKIDLFWNSASFQEMEPDVVENYIAIVKQMMPGFVFISAQPDGNFSQIKRITTREPVTAATYRSAFAPEYTLAEEFRTDYLLAAVNDARSYIFSRLEG